MGEHTQTKCSNDLIKRTTNLLNNQCQFSRQPGSSILALLNDRGHVALRKSLDVGGRVDDEAVDGSDGGGEGRGGGGVVCFCGIRAKGGGGGVCRFGGGWLVMLWCGGQSMDGWMESFGLMGRRADDAGVLGYAREELVHSGESGGGIGGGLAADEGVLRGRGCEGERGEGGSEG